MYLDHFGLKEPPFRITPHTDFFFQGANRGATLEALLYAITHDEGIVKVSGEVGSGKTMLCRVLIERLPSNVDTIYLANPSLSRDEILFAIADELQFDTREQRATRVLRGLQEHLIRLFGAGRRVVVLIDEAHAMPKETLEEIRLLSNLESNRHKLLQIVLFGQPELDAHLNTADMRQLKERITHSFRLEPLVRSDIENYIDFRMRAAGYRGPKVFTASAVRLVAAASHGLTRRINILADKALLAAFAAGTHAVSELEVRKAVRDSEFHHSRLSLQKIGIGSGALAAGLILGWGMHTLFPSGALPSPSPSSSVGANAGKAPATEQPPPPRTPVAAAPAAADSDRAKISAPIPAASAPSPGAAAPATIQRDPAPQLSPAAVHESAPVAATASVTQVAHHGPALPSSGELVRERFSVTQEWLKNAPGDHYAIQLVTVNSNEIVQLEDFLLRASRMVPAGELFVYSVKIEGQQHYRVAYGSYASPAQALSAMKELPPLFAAYHPYYRSVERMRSQNRQ
jgi:MSHA biogenesis protein MshM